MIVVYVSRGVWRMGTAWLASLEDHWRDNAVDCRWLGRQIARELWWARVKSWFTQTPQQ